MDSPQLTAVRREHPNSLDWKEQLRSSLQSVEALMEAGWISSEQARLIPESIRATAIRIPPYYLGLMRPGAHDPIRLQALPAAEEVDLALPPSLEGLCQEIFGRPQPWLADAIGDQSRLAAPRLTHRYGNRALLHVSSACSMYCRFCFRKSHLSTKEPDLYEGDFEPALQYLGRHPEIQELILTGGDPLTLTDLSLVRLLARFEALPHLRVVRIHSRIPVTLPYRITSALAEHLGRERPFALVLVTHFNHPRELTVEARTALTLLQRQGVTIYNQSVLLEGVNADATLLIELFQTLYEWGVHPYYLHHPDYTPQTSRFRLSIERGRQLLDACRGRISGPAVPDYVLDPPGGWGKISLLDRRVRLIDKMVQTPWAAEIYEIPECETRAGISTKARRYLNLYPSESETQAQY